MDIVSRIKIFLDKYNIANSQFADKCDIPRPTVSQLLNGRNKKVSDEVISKIHSAYPSLSIMWLMFGEEPMLTSPMHEDDLAERESGRQDMLAEEQPFTSADSSNRIVFDSELPAEDSSDDDIANNTPISLRTLEKMVENAGKSKRMSADGNVVEKRIINVMVFYSDNSFESFAPCK